MKEWLCLTCQMQRALPGTESVEPPLKPQASPNKVSTPAATQKVATANQKTDLVSTKKAEVADSPTPGVPQRDETKTPLQKDITQTSTTASPVPKETQDTISAPTKKDKTGSPPAPPTKVTTAVVSDLNKPLSAQASPVITDVEMSVQKMRDLTPPSSPATKQVPTKKEEKPEIVHKSADQISKSSDEVQPQQPLNKESYLVEKSLAKSPQPAAQPTQQESVQVVSFGSPKSQRADSKTTETVTGKMLGFGSSFFSSASTLITSAVQEESRTTEQSSRKMSAPAQVSDKMSASPKSSPPVSPKMTSAKEPQPPAAQKQHLEKDSDQAQQAKTPKPGQTQVNKGPSEPAKPEASQASAKIGQSCPLCKAELNMGSNDLPNYSNCTECKTNVCNKCGFSPMLNVTEVR